MLGTEFTSAACVPMLYDQDRSLQSNNEPWCEGFAHLCERLARGEHIRLSNVVYLRHREVEVLQYIACILTLWIVAVGARKRQRQTYR